MGGGGRSFSGMSGSHLYGFIGSSHTGHSFGCLSSSGRAIFLNVLFDMRPIHAVVWLPFRYPACDNW